MRTKAITSILLIVCGLGIGWLAYQNLMWAVWGKQNSWYEYLGFWGCPIMLLSGMIAFKSIRIGSYIGILGYAMMLFYYAPALIGTLQKVISEKIMPGPIQAIILLLVVALPVLTIVRLWLNVIGDRPKGSA